MPGWFTLTITAYNKTTFIRATTTAQKVYLENTFVIDHQVLEWTRGRRYYHADRAPDVSDNVLGAAFKAWLDVESPRNRYIYNPIMAAIPVPAVPFAPPAPVVPVAPPAATIVHVHAPAEPTADERLLAQIALERERTAEARRQVLKEQSQVLVERERANREVRAAQEDHLNAMRAEMQRVREQQAAERLELQRMRVENHQHFVQNNMYMARPPGRGAPLPRIRRPPPPSFAEILSLRLAQTVQIAGRLLVGNGNAGLNQRQRLLLDKHRGAGPRP